MQSDLETGDILIVDDDPNNVVAIEAALGEVGRTLVKAASGEAALRHLLTRDFALLLLDVHMPFMDGFETARLIRSRERTRHTPIIFITAYSQEATDLEKAYALGAVDFLFKPIQPHVLRAKAQVFVELRQRSLEVLSQAARLREAEQREHARKLEQERERWEAESLRRRVEEQQAAREALQRQTEQLAETVRNLERAEAALTRSNQQLAEADRRKDEFIAILAHELRNPLSPIVAGLHLIRSGRTEAKTLDAMDRQVRHLVRLVDDLLEVSRITTGKVEIARDRLDLNAVVGQAVAMSRPLLEERRHELSFEPCDELLEADGDAVRLTQIFSNLLNNAARYTDPGGRVAVRVRRAGDRALVEVADNGHGISPEWLERIFGMFVQTHRGVAGLGLGLALVKRLVDLHGGQVQAFSDGEGHGARFEVRLPLAEVCPGPPAPIVELRPISEGRVASLRVLVIDDSPDIGHTVAALLEGAGHTVEVASDGQAGLEALLRAPPDVAVVDIGMPGLDGYGIARRVRGELSRERPRMVAMTGFGQEADRLRALEAGFDAHVVKPVSADVLLQVLSDP